MVLEQLSAFSGLIRGTFYVFFFAATVVTFVFRERRYVKQAYLAMFLSGLVVVTLVGASVLPLVEMHKFANTVDDEEQYYQITIVDEQGTELRYDTRATPPVMGTRTSGLAESMVEDQTDPERLEMGRFLVSNAEEYRASVRRGERDGITQRLSAPRYVEEDRWTAADLEGTSAFVAIRIYERTIRFAEDNSEVADSSRRVVLEVNTDDETIREDER